MLFFGGFVCFWGERTRDFAFVSLCYGRSGEEMCTGYMPWPPAAECNMITNKQTGLWDARNLLSPATWWRLPFISTRGQNLQKRKKVERKSIYLDSKKENAPEYQGVNRRLFLVAPEVVG